MTAKKPEMAKGAAAPGFGYGWLMTANKPEMAIGAAVPGVGYGWLMMANKPEMAISVKEGREFEGQAPQHLGLGMAG
ncbi:unnamed protein product [Schistocephalus solidus]|uniref:NADH-u_ox-rdase domain-containing protein n=1 Tax=Schistocephalus solidus TaxID=70667 RepID=A0A183T683_SCHSO|nr:unnamed protein product [Schistocephalus solidus]